MNYELDSTMLITIGKVAKPFGVRGEIKVQPLTDFPERFAGMRRVYLVSPAGKESACEVKAVRYVGGAPCLLLSGYDSPEKSKVLNGWLIKVPVEETVPLPEGSYYQFELIGMEVLAENGERLGVITDIFETGSNDVYVMKHGKKEIYVPATKEVVKRIDRKKKQIIIHLIDGLMD